MNIRTVLSGSILLLCANSALAGSDWGYASGEQYFTIDRFSVFSMADVPGFEYIQVKTDQRSKKVCRTPESENATFELNKNPVQGERYVWQKNGECQITLIIRGPETLKWLVGYLSDPGHEVIFSDITGHHTISGRGFKQVWDSTQ